MWTSKHTLLINWVVVKVWKPCYVNCSPSLKVFWRTPQKSCEMTMKPWYEIMPFSKLFMLQSCSGFIGFTQNKMPKYVKLIFILKVHCCLKFISVIRCFPLLSALQLWCLATRSRQNPELVIHMKAGDSVFDFALIWNKPKADFFQHFQ